MNYSTQVHVYWWHCTSIHGITALLESKDYTMNSNLAHILLLTIYCEYNYRRIYAISKNQVETLI